MNQINKGNFLIIDEFALKDIEIKTTNIFSLKIPDEIFSTIDYFKIEESDNFDFAVINPFSIWEEKVDYYINGLLKEKAIEKIYFTICRNEFRNLSKILSEWKWEDKYKLITNEELSDNGIAINEKIGFVITQSKS